jgi:hypothetical protein
MSEAHASSSLAAEKTPAKYWPLRELGVEAEFLSLPSIARRLAIAFPCNKA